MAGNKTKIVALTELSNGYVFYIAANKIVNFYGINGGTNSAVSYTDYANKFRTRNVVESVSTINTAAGVTFSVTDLSGNVIYISPNRIVTMSDQTTYRLITYYAETSVLMQFKVSTSASAINTAAGNLFTITQQSDGKTIYLNNSLVVDITSEGIAQPAQLKILYGVDAATVTAAGLGFTVVPTVQINGDGTGATATATAKAISATAVLPGTGYAPTNTIVLAGGTNTTPTTLAVATTKLVTLAINAGGSGYAVGNTVTLAGGTNTIPAVITVTGVSSGAITTFTVTTGGSYTTNSATFTQASTSGSGTGATFQTGLFGVNTLTVSVAGSYTVLPTSPVAQASTSGSGTGATFSPSWGVNTVTITAAGSGYSARPTITFVGAGGTGATATVTTKLTSIAIISGGSGYATTPTIAITGDGSGATATATISPAGAINSVNVTAAGTGYTAAGYTISGGGGATIMYNIYGPAYQKLFATQTPAALQTTINAL